MITRFAPSPTGMLHLGHAYSAILAHDCAKAVNGRFLLRIEDIDRSRAREAWEAQIYEDLSWLGLSWERPVRRQSEHLETYREAIDRLWREGLLYPCSCTRADIAAALSAPQEGAMGPDGPVYPGICRPVKSAKRQGSAPDDVALRLDMKAALSRIELISFEENGSGPDGESGAIKVSAAEMRERVGDVVIARKDMGTSYHLSVVIDDAAQGITEVIRGRDLFPSTKIHVLLQGLLGLSSPTYRHHRLIRDDAGKRLAKRDDARAIALYRERGASPQDIRRMVNLPENGVGAMSA